MALADRIKEPPAASIHGHPCSVGELLNSLPTTEAEALNLMLTGTPERRWSQTEIFDAVTAEGHTVGRQSINRHRSGRCRCFPSAA
jgi:hypothetical protein